MLYFLFFLIAPVMVYASQTNICDIDERDWIILKTSVGVERDNAYGRGSVWTRYNKTFSRVEVFYLPEEVSAGGYRQCRSDLMIKSLPEKCGDIFRYHILTHFSHYSWNCKKKYSFINNGTHWAFVDAMKKVFTDGTYGTDGGLQPHAGSWARGVKAHPKSSSDKVLADGDDSGDHYGRGALWLSYEPQGVVLCYKPCGFCPEPLVYRCALNRPENVWPEGWSGVRDVVQRFAKSDCQSLQAFEPEHADGVIRMVKMILYGRMSGTSNSMWFSWRPVSGECDPVLDQQCKEPLKSHLIKGGCAEDFYTKRSAWFVEDNYGQCYWYYRSDDDFVFQYNSRLTIKPEFAEVWPHSKNDGELWLRVVDEFILNPQGLRDTRDVTA